MKMKKLVCTILIIAIAVSLIPTMSLNIYSMEQQAENDTELLLSSTDETYYLDKNCEIVVVKDAEKINADIMDLYNYTYIAEGDITINHRVNIYGSPILVLADNSSLTINGGINLVDSSTLTIASQSIGGNMGKLTAIATSYGDAGIGGSSTFNSDDEKGRSGGTLNVLGGNIYAEGHSGKGDADMYGAGIGGSSQSAVQSKYYTSIGGGDGGKVTIYNGRVTAVAHGEAAAVGGGGGGFYVTTQGISYTQDSAPGGNGADLSILGGSLTARADIGAIGGGIGKSIGGMSAVGGPGKTTLGDCDCYYVNSDVYTKITDAEKEEFYPSGKNVQIVAHPHHYYETEYIWTQSCSECTANQICKFCPEDYDGHLKATRTVEADYDYTPATCTEKEVTVYTAVFDAPFETQTKTVYSGDLLPHRYMPKDSIEHYCEKCKKTEKHIFTPDITYDEKTKVYTVANRVCPECGYNGNYTMSSDLENNYIDVSNHAYIDTGYTPNDTTRVTMTVDVQGKREYWFGALDESGAFGLGNDLNNVYAGYGDDSGGYGDATVLNGRHTVELNRNVAYIDGNVLKSFEPSDAFTLEYPLCLFAQNRAGIPFSRQDQGTIRCYECRIYDNDKLVRCFIPYTNENAEAGLYDLVECKFYGNANADSGTITANFSGVSYLNKTLSGNTVITEEKKIDETYPVTEYDTVWGSDSGSPTWYVLSRDVTLKNRPSVKGTVHLILTNWRALTASKGINVTENSNLIIHAQSDVAAAMGKLIVPQDGVPENNPAIGGSGSVTIHGGNLTLYGGFDGAGIGGGWKVGFNTATIYDGIINATGGTNAAGIGSGMSGTYENINIHGGNIKATGGNFCAGIGACNNGETKNLRITGGSITATGGMDAFAIIGTKGTVEDTVSIANYMIVRKGGTDGEIVTDVNEYVNAAKSNKTVSITAPEEKFELDIKNNAFTVTAAGINAGKGTIAVALYDSEKCENLLDIKIFDLANGDIPKGTFSKSGYVQAMWLADFDTVMPFCKPVGKYIMSYVKDINDAANNLSGDIDWGVHSNEDGFRYINDSKSVRSASVIKLFIMEYAFYLESRGELTMDQIIQGMTVAELLEKMITESNNDATNILIEEFGMPKLNKFFAENNYRDTKLERKMLDTEAVRQGKDNYTSVKDVMKFLDKVYDNKETYPYSEMLNIMKRQKLRNKIPVKIPNTVVIANKTGELENVENDVGIVFAENSDVTMVFMCTSLSSCKKAREFISDSAYLIYQYYTNSTEQVSDRK